MVLYGTKSVYFLEKSLFLFEKRNNPERNGPFGHRIGTALGLPKTPSIMENPLILPLAEPFAVGTSDFAFFGTGTVHCDDGAILFCLAGSAETTVDQYDWTIRRHTIILLLPGTLLRLDRRTDDFRMAYCRFTKELFMEIAGRFDPAFFRILREGSISDLPEPIAEGMKFWFQIVEYTYSDRGNLFRNIIIRNRLQNLFLEAYDKMQRFSTRYQEHRATGLSTHQSELFRRFIALVKEHCFRERGVPFYADKLCISTRYLAAVVRNTTHEPVKAHIDRAVVLEIKSLLQSTDLSVQEIAYRLHFPDQSYLGRYFKKHTGQSPSAFRKSLE